MHDFACEFAQIEAGIIGFVVIVIARAEIEPVGGQMLAFALRGFERDVPPRFAVAPVRGQHLVAEADVLADIAFVDDAVEIVEDGGAVGDRFLVRPGFEIEAQRMHVAVRPDAGIAEEVPGSPQIVTAFDDRETVTGRLVLHMRRHADAGDARTHNQNVEIGRRILHLSLPSGMSLPDAGPVRQSQLQGAT